LIPTPIQSALATMLDLEVPALLIGGQACILYGGAEFSRDLDLMVAARADSLPPLEAALHALEATLVALPALRLDFLRRGHAVHYRCGRADTDGLRIDIMTHPPRLGDLEAVWNRGVTFQLGEDTVPVIALADLIATKKTQRDKDWATIGELIEADIVAHRASADPEHLALWLREAREPDTLLELAAALPDLTGDEARQRPLLAIALRQDRAGLEVALAEEQIKGKRADREYWAPLRAELEQMRHEHRRAGNQL